jgi:hypothetical protein
MIEYQLEGTSSDLEQKFHASADDAMGREQAKRALSMLWDLGEHVSNRALVDKPLPDQRLGRQH